MEQKIFSVDKDDLSLIANQVKEVLLDAMNKDGCLNRPVEELKCEYTALIVSKGILGKFLDNILFSDDPKATKIIILRTHAVNFEYVEIAHQNKINTPPPKNVLKLVKPDFLEETQLSEVPPEVPETPPEPPIV
jgi:hypothetical protein